MADIEPFPFEDYGPTERAKPCTDTNCTRSDVHPEHADAQAQELADMADKRTDAQKAEAHLKAAGQISAVLIRDAHARVSNVYLSRFEREHAKGLMDELHTLINEQAKALNAVRRIVRNSENTEG